MNINISRDNDRTNEACIGSVTRCALTALNDQLIARVFCQDRSHERENALSHVLRLDSTLRRTHASREQITS